MKDNLFRFGLSALIVGGIISLIEVYLNNFNNEISYTNFLIAQTFIIYFVSTFVAIKKLGVLHIYSLLHITLFVFAFGGIVATPFLDIANFRVSYTPLYVKFKESVVQEVLALYCIFMVFSDISFYYFNRKVKKQTKLLINESRIDWYEIGSKTMIVFFPFAMWYAMASFNAAAGDRALIYQMGNEYLQIPLYLRLPNMFFTTGFYLMLASFPPPSKFVKYFILYMITMVPTLMMGERGEVVVPVIFYLWYYNKVYNKQIALSKIAILASILMGASFIVSVLRMGDTIAGFGISDLIIGFLGTSATSFSLLAYYVEFKGDIMAHNYPFILDSLIGSLIPGATGQSEHVLEVRSSIGHQLVYSLNPDYYLGGNSTGTSLIAESYEFGFVGVIFGAILLGWFLYFFEKRIVHGNYGKIFVFLFFQFIVLTPRGSLFVPLQNIIKFSICYIILFMIFKMISTIKYKKYKYEKS